METSDDLTGVSLVFFSRARFSRAGNAPRGGKARLKLLAKETFNINSYLPA
jgi:hypothetical protein